jgi:membrane fusion protein (multidrug efflux system)
VHPAAVTSPAAALVPEGEGFRVFVVGADSVAHARAVQVGARRDSLVEVTSGLVAGETVVSYGAYGVQDGAKVVRKRP